MAELKEQINEKNTWQLRLVNLLKIHEIFLAHIAINTAFDIYSMSYGIITSFS